MGRSSRRATVAQHSDFAIARYHADGSLDSGFDGDGKVLTDFGDFDRAEDVAIQPDGKIVTAEVYLARGVSPWLGTARTGASIRPSTVTGR